jgi:hypothetical protein
MNRTQKGKLFEKKAQDILEKQKYWIEKARHIRFHAQDLFGCWDLMAVSRKKIRFIQVSSEPFGSRSRADKERMLAFPKPPGSQKEYWRWNQKKNEFEIAII